MRIQIAAAVLILTSPAFAQTVPSTDKPTIGDKSASVTKLEPGLFKAFGNYGGWWNNISEAEKDAFIDGYITAMGRANSLSIGMCKATMNEAKPGAANFNDKFYGGMTLCAVAETFDFSVDKPLKPRLDEFYKEPLNIRIPTQFAMEYVRDEVSGKKTAGQFLDELNDWRKILKRRN
jgi:hypothetical protein